MLVLITLSFATIYLLPMFFAVVRNHPSCYGVALLTLLPGCAAVFSWSLVGATASPVVIFAWVAWFVALKLLTNNATK